MDDPQEGSMDVEVLCQGVSRGAIAEGSPREAQGNSLHPSNSQTVATPSWVDQQDEQGGAAVALWPPAALGHRQLRCSGKHQGDSLPWSILWDAERDEEQGRPEPLGRILKDENALHVFAVLSPLPTLARTPH